MTKSPPGWGILAVYSLPALSPSSLALALLQTPKGTTLSHIDLADSVVSDSEPWSVLRGSSISIREDIDLLDLGLVVSQGVERGEQGLVAITNRDVGALLLVRPGLDCVFSQSFHETGTGELTGVVASEVKEGDSPTTEAEIAAKSIILAMKQESGWADVIRATFGSRPKLNRERTSSC